MIAVYLLHTLKGLSRHIKSMFTADSVSFEWVVLGLGLYSFPQLIRPDGLGCVLLAGTLPVINSRQLFELQSFMENRPFSLWQKVFLFEILPVFSVNGILLLVGLILIACGPSGDNRFFASRFISIFLGYFLVLLLKKRVPFWGSFALRDLVWLGLFIAFLLSLWLSDGPAILLAIQLILVQVLLFLSFRVPGSEIRARHYSRLHQMRIKWVQIDNEFYLSLNKLLNSIEIRLLLFLSLLAWYYYFGTDNIVKDGAFILGVFQLGILAFLANNLLGLEGSGFRRFWLFPVPGKKLMLQKTKALSVWFLILYMPLFLGQIINFGWKTGLMTSLTHVNLGMLLLSVGVRSSVDSSKQRCMVPSTSGVIGGIRYLFLDFAVLLVPGFTGLTLFRRAPDLYLMICLVCLPVFSVFLNWNIRMAGTKWDKDRGF